MKYEMLEICFLLAGRRKKQLHQFPKSASKKARFLDLFLLENICLLIARYLKAFVNDSNTKKDKENETKQLKNNRFLFLPSFWRRTTEKKNWELIVFVFPIVLTTISVKKTSKADSE